MRQERTFLVLQSVVVGAIGVTVAFSLTAIVLPSVAVGQYYQQRQERPRPTRGAPTRGASETPLLPFDVSQMPTMAEVSQRVTGSDPIDTAARREGAFRQLSAAIRVMSRGGSFGDDMTPQERAQIDTYIRAAQQADQVGRGLAASRTPPVNWFVLEQTYDNTMAGEGLMQRLWPALWNTYQSHKAHGNAERSREMNNWRQGLEQRQQEENRENVQRRKEAEAAQARLEATPEHQQKKAEEAKAAVAQATAATKERRAALLEAAKASDAEAKAAALADNEQGRKHKVDMTVCGVALGVPLDLPNCDEVGHVEQGLFGKRMVSDKTCFQVNDDGSSSIHFGTNACPQWASAGIANALAGIDDIKTVTRAGNVLVGVEIGFMSGAPGNDELPSVATALKQLRAKYGKPTRVEEGTINNGFGAVIRRTYEPEWKLPGLHVVYDAQPNRDSVTIELQSVVKTRAHDDAAREAAEPKL